MKKENKNDDEKFKARKSRGQISSDDLKPFKEFKPNDLISLLSDEDPQKRTIAANLLSSEFINDNDEDIDKEVIIISLAKSFKEEKALYSRIAISKSLSSYGRLSVPYLIDLLAKIGNNQEKELPKKYFNKKSFPLPRDLASRTLAIIGEESIPYLINVLEGEYSHFIKEQALDAIGLIAYKYMDYRAFDSINNLFNETLSSGDINEKSKKILIWKITRSLSGFKNNEDALNLVINISKKFDSVPEIQWETIRSIGQIGIVNDNVKIILNGFENIISKNEDIVSKNEDVISKNEDIVSKNENNSNDNANSQIKLALNVSKDILGIW